MAIRERKGRPKPWQCYWNNPVTGRRESASFASKEEAEKEDSLIKHRLRFERESFAPENANREDMELTLEEGFLAYLREKKYDRKAMSLQLAVMRPILEKYGTYHISEIDFNDVLEIIRIPKNGKNLRQTSIFRNFSVVRALVRWNADQGNCELPKMPHVPHGTSERYIPPTLEELEKMLAVAQPHIQRVIIIGVQTGCRVGPCELLRLKWQDVDLVRGIIHVCGTKKNRNSPWRDVPIREGLVARMAAWDIEDKEAGQEYLIHYGGKPVRLIRCAWKNTLQRAGITRKIRPYDLRHAFATQLIAGGADIGTVATLMGHANPSMLLKHYQYVMDSQKRAAIESLPDIPYVPTLCAQKNCGS